MPTPQSQQFRIVTEDRALRSALEKAGFRLHKGRFAINGSEIGIVAAIIEETGCRNLFGQGPENLDPNIAIC